MTRKKSRPHHREKISTEFEGYKMLWSSIENDENSVQRVPSPTDIPKRSHPVATMDSGDDSHDGNSDESNQMISNTKSGNSPTPLDRRISSDVDEERSYVQNLFDDLNSKPANAQLSAAILPYKNSSTPPSQLGSPSNSIQSDPAIERAQVSRCTDDLSPPERDITSQNVENEKRSCVVETDDNTQQESAQQENFPSGTVNGHSENESSAENTRFSDLTLSPVQPLVELSDLTPLLGNSPQSPNRGDPPQDIETPVESTELVDDVSKAPLEPIPDAAVSPPSSQNSDLAEQTAIGSEKLEASRLQVEPPNDECPPPMSTLESPPAPQDVDQSPPETQEPTPSPGCVSDPCEGHVEDNVDVPADPESSQDDLESRTADDMDETQVRSPFPPEMHEDEIDVNKCNPDPMDLGQSEDDSNCASDKEIARSPVPNPPPLSSTTTGQALNLLRAMLVSNDDDMDFSNFSCIEPLGPDFDPSNVNFLTHSEINKELSADQLGSSVDFKEKESLFNEPASQTKNNVCDEDFPKCTIVCATIMKVEPEYKSDAIACFNDFLECIMEDSGVFTMTDTDIISSESSDVDSITDDAIDDSDSTDIDRCHGKCQVIVERLPTSLAKTDHISLSNKRYVAWRTNYAKERNEELFQNLRVWRRGRLLLWRECELAGMDRETYDRQVEYVKLHKIEVSCADSASSDSEDASVDSRILPTYQISSDSSDSEISFDFEVASARSPPAVVSSIRQKPRPKSKKLEFQNRHLSGSSLASPLTEEYVVGNNSANEGMDSNVGNPPSALKITIRKTSISKSDDENEGPVEREISSDDDIPVALPVVKKVRRVAMKRTTRRVRSPVRTPEPAPSIPSSSTDDEFPPNTLSPLKSSPPDTIRKKKSYFVEENENNESLLGRRADEVENHNLLERFEIPFEEPTLFRSPRMASKLAQLKNKEAFKSTIKHPKVPKIDPVLKDVKIVVDELVLKTVEAILTQPRSRNVPMKKHPSEDINPEINATSIVEKVLTPPMTVPASESVDILKTGGKPFNAVGPVDSPLTEISSSVSASLRGKKQVSVHAGKDTANTMSSPKESAVTSTHQMSTSLSVSDPKDSHQPSKAFEAADSENFVESGVIVDSSQCNATPTTTCQGEIRTKESTPDRQPNQDQRATRARQPIVDVDLDLIETLMGKKKKRPSTNKESQKIAESPTSFLEIAGDSLKSDHVNDATNISADDYVTTTSKTQTRKKKRRRLSRFSRKRVQKPVPEKIVRESNSENEEEDDISKSLVQVAEISEGKGSEPISVPTPVPSTPELQFTRRVLRSHPRAANLKNLSTVSENIDSDLASKKAGQSEEKVEQSKGHISANLSTSISSSSAVNLSNVDRQSGDLKLGSEIAASECPPEPPKTSTFDVQPNKDQAPRTEQPTAMNIEELPEISENLNLETEGDEESILDDWKSVGSPVGEVDNPTLEKASESNKNACDESSILFDALLASSFNKKSQPSKTSKSEVLSTSFPSGRASSQELSKNANLQQPNEDNTISGAMASQSGDNMKPCPADNELTTLNFSGIAGSENSNFPGFNIEQMTALAKAMEETSGTDIVDGAGQGRVDDAMLENNRQPLLNSEEQLDFSSLSNILNMADSAEDLIIDQPFSDEEEPEQNELNDCIIDIIQNHIVVLDSPTKGKNSANSGATKDSGKSQSKDNSIDERTGLPTTLIQRLRDPRIRSKVMSQLEGGEKVTPPQIPVQATPTEPSPSVDNSKATIEAKDNDPRTVENVSRDPRALRSTTMITRSCTEATQKVIAQPNSMFTTAGDKVLSGTSQENPITSTQLVAQADTPSLTQTAEDSGHSAVADEEDEEEEALKRRPKKAKKTIDTELMYKSPLEDLEKEQSYGRNRSWRYPINEPRPRGYLENRPSRWDMRNAVGKTGPQESSRHPDLVQIPSVRSQPVPLIPVAPPVLHVHNQHNWMMDQNADCLPSYVESPQWQGNWMNDQQFNPVDRRKAWMAAEIASLQREPKTVDLTKSAIRKPVMTYIKNAFKDILPKPPFDLNPDDKEVVISMMDPFGQEIDMVQLPRPTANLTKAYLTPVSNYKLIEEMVSNPAFAFSRYMDEEKVDELVLDFFDEDDAAKIVRMQSHVPTKRSGFLETEQTPNENDINEENTDRRSETLFDKGVVKDTKVKSEKESNKVEIGIKLNETGIKSSETGIKSSETGIKSNEMVKLKDSAISGESKLNDEPSDQSKAAKKPKIPQPPGKMEFLDIILHHLPILKEQYSFKTTPLKAPDENDSSKSSLISGPSDLLSLKTSFPDTPASPSPPMDVKPDVPAKNPSPPRIMKALLNLTKSEKLGTRRTSKRSRSKSRSPPIRKRSKSPAEYRSCTRRHRRSSSPPRRSPVSRRRSRSPDDYRQKGASRRSRSPKRHRRIRVSKETTSSECSTPRYSRSSRSPSPSSRRRSRCAPSVNSSRSSTPAPLPKAYRRSWTRSPSDSYRSRSISKSPPRKRYSKR